MLHLASCNTAELWLLACAILLHVNRIPPHTHSSHLLVPLGVEKVYDVIYSVCLLCVMKARALVYYTIYVLAVQP